MADIKAIQGLNGDFYSLKNFGIGLTICKKTVEQLGGRTWAESEKVV